jgi:hypothetical protein
MNWSPVLDTAIALVFIYVVLSLVSIAINEVIVRFISLRSKTLKRGLEELLGDAQLVKNLYESQLVKGLKGKENGEPTSIPSANFAQALISELGEKGKALAGSRDLFNGFKDYVEAANCPKPLQALRPLVEEAEAEIARLRKGLEDWFDSSTKSLTEFYRNRTRIIALIVGFALAVAFNADTFSMATKLYRDSGMRSAIVAQAEATVAQPLPFDTTSNYATPEESTVVSVLKTRLNKEGRDLISQMKSMALPLGGNRFPWPKEDKNRGWNLVIRVLGWLFTGVAVSMGAPFWYDLLGRLVGIRASLKSKEKAPA